MWGYSTGSEGSKNQGYSGCFYFIIHEYYWKNRTFFINVPASFKKTKIQPQLDGMIPFFDFSPGKKIICNSNMKFQKYVYSNTTGSAVVWSPGRGSQPQKMHRDLNAFSRAQWIEIFSEPALLFLCSCVFARFLFQYVTCLDQTPNPESSNQMF